MKTPTLTSAEAHSGFGLPALLQTAGVNHQNALIPIKQESALIGIKTVLGRMFSWSARDPCRGKAVGGSISRRNSSASMARWSSTKSLGNEITGHRWSELERGARMEGAITTNTMLPEIDCKFLADLAAGNDIKGVHEAAKEGSFPFGFDEVAQFYFCG